MKLGDEILDGRNRYRAGLIAEVVAPDGQNSRHFRDFDPAVDGDPLKFVLSKNLARRHLNESQRAMVAARLANMPSHRPTTEDKRANLHASKGDAGEKLNVSPRSVASAKKVQEHGSPGLIKAVDGGHLAVSAAAQAAKLPAEQQDAIAALAEKGVANVVRTVIKQGRRAEREKTLGAQQMALPDKKFGVILADPEWEFVTFSKITGVDRSASNHYPTSPWESIGARDVQKIAGKDCVLLLWVTDLARGIDVLRSWGFEYKSYFVWVKDIVPLPGVPGGFETVGAAGTGYWNRDRDELLLIGTRGDIPCPAPGTQGESVWFAPRPKIAGTERGRHSAKPENAHLWVEQHYPSLPKIELNARAARAGWEVWGNEAPQPEDENQDRHEVEFNQAPAHTPARPSDDFEIPEFLRRKPEEP